MIVVPSVAQWFEVVRGGSVKLNYPELMSNFTLGLDPCVVLWFEEVQKSRTTPNL